MAYAGSGTQIGKGIYASGQILWNNAYVLEEDGTVYLPVFRLPGTPQLHVVVQSVPGYNSPVEVDVTVFGGDLVGPVTGDLITTGRYRPIREPVPLVVPVGEARDVRWDYVPHPAVVIAISDAREQPSGVMPFVVSVGATS